MPTTGTDKPHAGRVALVTGAAEAADTAGSVFLIASDEAGWITGQTIMANGGNAFGL